MILNGLGFVSAPLYLFEQFFVGKATEHLIAPGVRPEHLNDDRLGRVLDKLFEADPSKVFVDVALRATRHFGVRTESVHLDATSLHLHGHYAHDNQEAEPEAIRITYGYSRDHRPELKQFVMDLMCTGDGGIPLFLRVADGNDADQATFAKLLAEFKMRLNVDALLVADSALYSADKLPTLNHLSWLCRVPQTIKEAKTLLEEIPWSASPDRRSEALRGGGGLLHNQGSVRWCEVGQEMSGSSPLVGSLFFRFTPLIQDRLGAYRGAVCRRLRTGFPRSRVRKCGCGGWRRLSPVRVYRSIAD